MGRLVKGALDVSGHTAGVPIDEPLDKGVDALVEDGLQRVFLSGEVVIEQRARAAHALGYGRDGQAADPVFLDGGPHGSEDVAAPIVVCESLVVTGCFAGHDRSSLLSLPLPIPVLTFVDKTSICNLTKCQRIR